MKAAIPDYVLTSESSSEGVSVGWKFLLEAADGSDRLEAADHEPHTRRERLELLAVVRGLEALNQPSRVTIRTSSQYVRRGLAYGLEEWRTNGWTWEHYGQMVRVKNDDLWQRLDRALRIHDVKCRSWRLDPPHQGPERSTSMPQAPSSQRVPRPHFPLNRWWSRARRHPAQPETPMTAAVAAGF